MEVRVCDLGWEQQPVVLQAAGLSQLLEPLRPQHLSQGIGGIDRTVDDDVSDMDALGCELCVECLAEHASPAHGRRVRVLPIVSSHSRRRRRHQDRSLAPCFHERADGRCDAKESKGRKPPAHLEGLVAGVLQCPVADLGTQVEYDDLDRADVRLDRANAFFDAVGLDGIEQEARCRSALPLDALHHVVETFLVSASTEDSVIALPSKPLPDIAADASAGSDDQTDRVHALVTPRWLGWGLWRGSGLSHGSVAGLLAGLARRIVGTEAELKVPPV